MSSSNRPPFFECEFCGKKLVKKEAFDRHECEKLKRFKLCKTKKGLNAFEDYKYWLSRKGRTVKKLQTFMDSKFFNSFVEFQSFAADKGIPDKKLYMNFMTDYGLSPMLWRTENIYQKFIEYYDSETSPEFKAKLSLKTMMKLSNILECDIADVFDNLLPSEVARLIYERRLSPWLLLFSKRFKQYLHMLSDPSQHLMITTLIDPMEWQQRFRKEKEAVKKIKAIVSELDL